MDIHTIQGRLQNSLGILVSANNAFFHIENNSLLPLTRAIANRGIQQIDTVINNLVGVIEEINVTTRPEETVIDSQYLDKLTIHEVMQLANLEHCRRSLVAYWRHIEDQKAGLLKLAKERTL